MFNKAVPQYQLLDVPMLLAILYHENDLSFSKLILSL